MLQRLNLESKMPRRRTPARLAWINFQNQCSQRGREMTRSIPMLFLDKGQSQFAVESSSGMDIWALNDEQGESRRHQDDPRTYHLIRLFFPPLVQRGLQAVANSLSDVIICQTVSRRPGEYWLVRDDMDHGNRRCPLDRAQHGRLRSASCGGT